VDFELIVVGNMGDLQYEIETKEKLSFTENNVLLLGYTDSEKLYNLLLSADIYVHTAYIDNSPNSICEAQYLGLPIISTDVGGIPSLVENDKDGVLVPANSCYIMAYEIMKLANDKYRQRIYSVNNIKKAHNRHNPQHILKELLECYNSILNV
jgi:glycosyltransferase involved in cell wall biosynthesis